MRYPIAVAAGCVIIGTALAQVQPELLVARYLVRPERLLAGNDSGGALAEMDALIALLAGYDLELTDSFDFKYAEVAFATGRTRVEADSLNDSLMAARRSGDFYRQTLELLDKSELAMAVTEADAEAAAGATGRITGDVRVCDGLKFVWIAAREMVMGSFRLEADLDERQGV